MCKIITKNEFEYFKKDGAVLIKGKFDNVWIEKLKKGIKKAKENSKIIYRGDWAKEERTVM